MSLGLDSNNSGGIDWASGRFAWGLMPSQEPASWFSNRAPVDASAVEPRSRLVSHCRPTSSCIFVGHWFVNHRGAYEQNSSSPWCSFQTAKWSLAISNEQYVFLSSYIEWTWFPAQLYWLETSQYTARSWLVGIYTVHTQRGPFEWPPSLFSKRISSWQPIFTFRAPALCSSRHVFCLICLRVSLAENCGLRFQLQAVLVRYLAKNTTLRNGFRRMSKLNIFNFHSFSNYCYTSD